MVPSQDVLNELILESITDIKGKRIVKLDLRAIEDAPTDYFFICEGDSTTQVRAIAENVKIRVKQEIGVIPDHFEGLLHAKWVCVDYFDTVLHVFYPETRTYYALEELWGDAVMTEYDEV